MHESSSFNNISVSKLIDIACVSVVLISRYVSWMRRWKTWTWIYFNTKGRRMTQNRSWGT